jgi:hypothetical protein
VSFGRRDILLDILLVAELLMPYFENTRSNLRCVYVLGRRIEVRGLAFEPVKQMYTIRSLRTRSVHRLR